MRMQEILEKKFRETQVHLFVIPVPVEELLFIRTVMTTVCICVCICIIYVYICIILTRTSLSMNSYDC